MKRRWQAWQYLIIVLGAFWLIFAAALILGELPFYIITLALSTTGMLSLLVVALAWAYQNNF